MKCPFKKNIKIEGGEKSKWILILVILKVVERGL